MNDRLGNHGGVDTHLIHADRLHRADFACYVDLTTSTGFPHPIHQCVCASGSGTTNPSVLRSRYTNFSVCSERNQVARSLLCVASQAVWCDTFQNISTSHRKNIECSGFQPTCSRSLYLSGHRRVEAGTNQPPVRVAKPGGR